MGSCRDCAQPGPGGPAVLRYTAFDALCGNLACTTAGSPQVYVNLADLGLFVQVGGLAFAGARPALVLEQYYNQDGSASGPLGSRWSFNLGETLTADADSSLVLRRGAGNVDRFAPAAASSSYFAITSTTDTLARNADGSYTLSSGGSTRTFSADGRLLAIQDGGVTRAALEYNGTRLATVRSHGRTLSFTWDGAHITSIADSAGRSVGYTYNADGTLASQTSADGQTASYTYNDAGLLSAITYAGGATRITYNYDERFASVASVTTPDGAVRRYDIPRTPSEIRVTDGAGNATRYVSTPLGWLQSVTDAQSNATTFTYDSAGRRTSVTNPSGETTRFEYDGTGNPTALVDSAGNRWSAEYADGLMSRVTDPRGNGWSFGYDGGVLSAVAAPSGATTIVGRNAAGAINKLSLNGQDTTFQYDADGLVRSATTPAGTTVGYQYDGAGRVSLRTDAAGNTVRPDYGATLQPAGYTAGGNRQAAGESGIVRDAQGRVTAQTDSFGNFVTYGWNAAGQLKSITLAGTRTITYDYDRSGRLAKVADWAGNFAVYRYDAAGYPASINFAGGPVTVYQYDAAHNLKAIVSTGADGAAVAAYRYTLDAANNRTGINALEPSGNTPRYASATFGFDPSGRPLSRDGASYQYDSRGLLTAVQGGPNFGLSFDAFGRPQAVSGDITASYQYDALGLRVARSGSGGSRRYVYDVSGARRRLLMETGVDNTPSAYYVWGLTLLWKVTPDGKPYFYHCDGSGNVVAVSNPAAGVVNRYRYDAAGRMVASEEGIENPFRARGAAGVIDDGNGLLYTGDSLVHADLRLEWRTIIDTAPPLPDPTPPLAPAGLCLYRGIATCPLAAGRSIQ